MILSLNDDLPTLPDGSSIVVTKDREGTELAWLPEPSRPWALIGVTALLLCGWLYGEWFVLRQYREQGFSEGAGTLFITAWVAAWTIIGWFVIIMLMRMLRAPLPERVVLGEKTFAHNQGRRPMTLERLQSLRTWWPVSARRTRTTDRDGKLRFVLDNSGDRQKLLYETEAEQIEVGPNLRAPDREWLSDVLRGWSEQAS